MNKPFQTFRENLNEKTILKEKKCFVLVKMKASSMNVKELFSKILPIIRINVETKLQLCMYESEKSLV